MAIGKNWREKSKQTKEFPVEAFGGETVRVRPMSAARQTAIDKRFVADESGKLADPSGYAAALVADSVVDETNSPVWSDVEVMNDLDFAAFREIADIVQKFIAPVLPKNSTPAIASPSA